MILDKLKSIEEKELDIKQDTYDLIDIITTSCDEEVLSKANKICIQNIKKIKADINSFKTDQIPTVFAALQLFAVESGQYGLEVREDPDSEINKLIKNKENYRERKEAYDKAKRELNESLKVRKEAIEALKELFKREEFSEIKEFIEGELYPLIDDILERFRPFRTSQATLAADKIYKIAQRTSNEELKSLLLKIFDKKEKKFGTSGFRAFIDKDFTQRSSDLVSLAICNELKKYQKKEGKTVVIVYDTRIGAKEFAQESARVFLANGFKVKISKEAAPTGSLVHWLIEEEKCEAAGGENMTPSHNPLSSQGQRWSLDNGDVAPTSVTDRIEREVNLLNLLEAEVKKDDLNKAEYIDLRESYTNWVADFLKNQKVNIFDKDNKLKEKKPLVDLLKEFYSKNYFTHNAMHGAARFYVQQIFEKIGCANAVVSMDSNNDSFLGNRYYANPEERWLMESAQMLKKPGGLFMCATDTDGDRCGGIVDREGFVNLNKLMAMLQEFVVKGLGWENHIAIRTGTTSTALDDVVKKQLEEGFKVHTPEADQINSLLRHPFYSYLSIISDNDEETKELALKNGFSSVKEWLISLQTFNCVVVEVGFKYISAAMKKYDTNASVAGEESGGFSVKKFPDKDGIMGICLIASMIAWNGVCKNNRIPSKIWEEHKNKYGESYDSRLDVWTPDNPKEKIINWWLKNPLKEFAGQKIVWTGGTLFDKVEVIMISQEGVVSRLVIRASGTENMNRAYIETKDKDILEKLKTEFVRKLNSLIFEDVLQSKNVYDLSEKIASTGMTFMDEETRKRYFEKVKEKIDDFGGLKAYLKVKNLLSDIDRDTNVRHRAYHEDILGEFYSNLNPYFCGRSA